MCKYFFAAGLMALALVALLAGVGIPASRLVGERKGSPDSNTIAGRRGVLRLREMTLTRTERGKPAPKGKQHTAPLVAAWRVNAIVEK
ncbi:hypothetical protein CIX30_07125 [Salmonella enterica]|nr:hypothetical protein [Salmonella enterica]EBN6863094.1 hypothetical protein [Salmonella enterica]ECP9799117.1 hypothetical protein [Salmonella enterica]ECS7524371.1 hypothetical protein [Salmonella enterica]ECU7991860.1 hypothetical protein [Salmonella enterica subsp. enterica serovar Toucra]